MNSFGRYLIAATFVGGLPAAALAQAPANTTASATIVRPLTITKTSDMAFGRIILPATGNGAVTLPANADTATPTNVTLLGAVTRAKYTIDGEGGQVVTIATPPTFDMAGPGADVLTVTLASDLGAATTLSNALGAAGTATLNLGGSFPVAFNTTAGTYTGTFDVTVSYQ